MCFSFVFVFESVVRFPWYLTHIGNSRFVFPLIHLVACLRCDLGNNGKTRLFMRITINLLFCPYVFVLLRT